MSSDVLYRFASAAEWVLQRPPTEVLQELRGFVAGLPFVVNLTDQLLARGLVMHILAHIGAAIHLELYPGLVKEYFALAAAPWSSDEWFIAFGRLAEQLESTLRDSNDLGPGIAPLEVRMSKALRYIDGRYHDSDLSLRQVADHSGLSVSHLAHMIRLQTGRGFVAYLRGRRVDAARRLLDESVLSVKEIAAIVGYGTRRQFERDFKRHYGVTPGAVRRGLQPEPA